MSEEFNDKAMQKQFEERHENLKSTVKDLLPSRGDSTENQSSCTADFMNQGAKDAADRNISAMKQANPEQFETAAAKVDETFGGNALTEKLGSKNQ